MSCLLSPWPRTTAALLAVCAAIGCGRLGFDENASPDGGGVDAGAVFRFEAPVAIDDLEPDTAISIDDPTLSGDRLELLFNHEQPDNDVFGATRASPDARWSGPARVDELSSGGVDSTPKMRSDGLELTLGTSRGPGGDLDLYVSTRASRGDPWGAPTELAELNTDDQEFSGAINAAGTRMYFSRRDANGFTTVYETTRASVGDVWGPPRAHDFGAPSATDAMEIDDLTVVLAVRQPDDSVDLVIAARASEDGPFAVVEELVDVNSTGNETDPWLSPDGAVLLFTSNRSGVQRIYRAARRR